MKLNLEITSIEDAKYAIIVLSAYAGVTIDTVEEKPKAVKETVVKETVVTKPETTVEEKPKAKRTVKAKAPTFTKETVTALAKSAVAESDRETVKKTISKYGSKISEVNEADYEALSGELQTLIDEAV